MTDIFHTPEWRTAIELLNGWESTRILTEERNVFESQMHQAASAEIAFAYWRFQKKVQARAFTVKQQTQIKWAMEMSKTSANRKAAVNKLLADLATFLETGWKNQIPEIDWEEDSDRIQGLGHKFPSLSYDKFRLALYLLTQSRILPGECSTFIKLARQGIRAEILVMLRVIKEHLQRELVGIKAKREQSKSRGSRRQWEDKHNVIRMLQDSLLTDMRGLDSRMQNIKSGHFSDAESSFFDIERIITAGALRFPVPDPMRLLGTTS